MFIINEDKSIYVTRGDAGAFNVKAKLNDNDYLFRSGDIVRFKVFEKKKCDRVVLEKDIMVKEDTDTILVFIKSDETKFGDVISKPVDYWYEIELNPETDAQTIIGYDEDGAKVLKLFPEGGEVL